MDATRRLLRRIRGRTTSGRHRAQGPARDKGFPGADVARLEPPPCPAGWRTGPPDFIGLGAQKAGTTWWFDLIAAHDGVYLPPRRRETHFFDRYLDHWPGRADIELYARFFPRSEGVITGEKTPAYLADHWVPAMLARAAPDVRLIALLRDPIERYRSGRTHAREHGWPEDRVVIGDQFQRGLYAAQLHRYLDHFPRDRLLVLQYEQCVAQKELELARTYDFLGLPPHDVALTESDRQRGARRSEKLELEPERRALLVDLYSRDIERLLQLVPDLDLTLWPDFRHLSGVSLAD